MVETADFSETPAHIYQTAQRFILRNDKGLKIFSHERGLRLDSNIGMCHKHVTRGSMFHVNRNASFMQTYVQYTAV